MNGQSDDALQITGMLIGLSMIYAAVYQVIGTL